jgi:hypothetical protein
MTLRRVEVFFVIDEGEGLVADHQLLSTSHEVYLRAMFGLSK